MLHLKQMLFILTIIFSCKIVCSVEIEIAEPEKVDLAMPMPVFHDEDEPTEFKLAIDDDVQLQLPRYFNDKSTADSTVSIRNGLTANVISDDLIRCHQELIKKCLAEQNIEQLKLFFNNFGDKNNIKKVINMECNGLQFISFDNQEFGYATALELAVILHDFKLINFLLCNGAKLTQGEVSFLEKIPQLDFLIKKFLRFVLNRKKLIANNIKPVDSRIIDIINEYTFDADDIKYYGLIKKNYLNKCGKRCSIYMQCCCNTLCCEGSQFWWAIIFAVGFTLTIWAATT